MKPTVSNACFGCTQNNKRNYRAELTNSYGALVRNVPHIQGTEWWCNENCNLMFVAARGPASPLIYTPRSLNYMALVLRNFSSTLLFVQSGLPGSQATPQPIYSECKPKCSTKTLSCIFELLVG